MTPLPSQKPEGQNAARNARDKCGDPDHEAAKAENVIARPPSNVPPAPPNSPNPTDSGQGHYRTKPNWVEVSMFIIEIVGIIGLAVYCWINFRELQVFDSERKTMESEFQSNQKVSERQLLEMQQSRILDERAWLGVLFLNVESNIPGHPTGICFNPEVKNTGKTPALNVIISQSFTHDRNAIPIFDQASPSKNVLGFIQAGGTETGAVSVAGAVFDHFDIQKESPFYIYGTVWYDDIFGGHHWTQYRNQVVQGITNLCFIDIASSNACDDATENGPK